MKRFFKTIFFLLIWAIAVPALAGLGIMWHRHAAPRYATCIGCMKCVSVCPHGCFRNPLAP